jgi:formylglycine-generating enzyme required for sulfatase activity
MKTILILASNPRRDLNLDREIRDLKGVVERSRNREDLKVEIGLAVRPGDLHQLFLDYEPQIVHFCGHGTGDQGLVLENDSGQERPVSTEALSSLFSLFTEQVECVLLNACFSEVQATAIVDHIPYVVGMSQEIRDDAAIAFSTGFYRALGYGRAIAQAYKFGCNAIQLQITDKSTTRSTEGDLTRKLIALDASEPVILPEHLKPVLKVNPNLVPEKPATLPSSPDDSAATTQTIQVEQPAPKPSERLEKDRSTDITEDLGNGVILELVAIPAGTFLMGSPESEPDHTSDEEPLHSVTVSAFWMSKYPVTQAQWRSVAALPKIDRDLDPDPADFKDDQRPVEKVSWREAFEFCARLSLKAGRIYRLPSEAEWEYACRAGTASPFYFGDQLTSEQANYNADRQQTTIVGNLGTANSFGLWDMHGNVWEWCLDHWHKNYKNAPTDGSAWTTEVDTSRRLLRGGSWEESAGNCRSAYRYALAPNNWRNTIGFRVVVS